MTYLTSIFHYNYSPLGTTIDKVFDEEVYMEQPPRLVAQGESSNMVCLLYKFLYGLKQSPCAWFKHFHIVIQQFGIIRSDANHSLFYHHSSLHRCTMLI